ncbi:MAG: ATP-binding protein, partial [Thiovulaceae bacterium]|nr:ATP-binding protein [Sulfurimonadaceae bacterium]
MHAKPFFDRLQSFVKICMSPEKHYQKDEWLLKVKTDTSIIMIFIAAVTLFSLSISNFYHHENFLASVELIITLVLLPALYLLRNKKSSYNPISFLFFITWFIILMIHFTITSNNEINILWFVSFFVTVFFLRDKREGMIWLLITLTYLSTVFLFSKQDHPLSDYVIMIVNILFISLILFWYEVLKQKDTEHLLQHNDHLEDEIALHTVDLKDAKIKADEQNLAKSEFLANMSHEIRTPLNAIQGFIQLLQEQEDQPQKRKYLKTIKQSSDTLLEIINDILDISKIESNKLDITHTDFDSHELFNSIKDLFHARSLEKNIFFHVALDPELPLYLFSDPLRLRQIITNLLSNALKFTPANGSINFRVTYDRGNLTLSVKDNGIGIPKDRQKKIFEQFSQADGSTTYVYGGTGLGLTISSKLVQLLQGELKVSSQVGLGSEFYFTIPVTKGKKPEKLEGSTLTMPQRFQAKVLLVEDNDANQLF